jgi:hypothetical protein
MCTNGCRYPLEEGDISIVRGPPILQLLGGTERGSYGFMV